MFNSMTLFLDNFHFMRPWWLLAIPAVLLIFWRLRQHAGDSDWPAFISPHLLQYLVTQTGPAKQTQRSTLHILWLVLGVLLVLALAGPAWKRLPQPVEEKVNAMVIVLDLSLSMTSTDITPSRIARARFKIQDILSQRKEGLTGLVVYAGDAHTVVPLTEDTANIAALLPSLTPWLMPVKGSRPDLAIEQAVEILKGGTGGFATSGGHILLITDAVKPDEIAGVNSHLNNTPHRVSLLTVGTKEGAPISLPNGQYLKDEQGHLVLPKLDFSAINAFANGINASVTQMSNTDADVRTILSASQGLAQTQETALDATQDVWQDEAFWLVWLLIPFGAFMFRRGYIVSLCLCALMLSAITPQNSYAFNWADLWKSKDQRAQKAFDDGKFDDANQQFEDPAWRRAAAYRAENYQEAASDALNTNTADDHYNRANALALSGDLEAAIEAYDTALATDPNLESAQHNRDIVEELLKQQQESQDQQSSDQSQDSEQSQDQSEKDSDQNGQGQNSQDQQNGQSDEQQSADNQDQSQQAQQQESQQNSQQGSQNNPQNNKEQKNQDASQAQSEAEEELEALEQRQQMAQGEEDKNQDQHNGEPQQAQALTQAEEAQMRATEEQQQALERVIDDPGGLLRRKFILESRRRQREQQGQRQPTNNGQIW